VVAVAETQFGVLSHEQLCEIDGPIRATEAQIRRWVRDGRLVKVAPRVWRVAGSPVTWRQRLVAGLLSLGSEACVSHEAAAQLHGFDRTPADHVEFTIGRPRRSIRLEETVHTTKYWPRTDRVSIDGLRVTSATRTVIDLARARAPEARLQAAIESAVRTGASAPLVIERRLSELRGPGRWGCRLLDRVLLDAGGHTMLERRFLQLMRAAGLPRPSTQVVFRSDQRTVARVDFLYRELAIVVEVTGRRGHSSPSERARDAQRRNELQDMGVRVFEYTWEDVTRRAPYVTGSMRERLDAA
jgi:very-short-patch-repair endonuclease